MAEQNSKEGIHVQGTIQLKEAKYQVLPPDNRQNRFEVNDSVICFNLSTEGFKLSFSRIVGFSTPSNFEIAITYESDISFEDKAGEKLLKTEEAIKDWAEKNKVRIANTFRLPARASHLIADLSEAARFEPIVTAPSVIVAKTAD